MKERIRIILLMLTIALTTFSPIQAQEDVEAHFDSLSRAFRSAQIDSVRLRIASQIALEHYNVDTVIAYSDAMIEFGKSTGHLDEVSKALSFKAWAYYTKGEYGKASEMAYEGIMTADSIGNKYHAAKCYHHLANAYSMLRDAVTANIYYHKSISLYEEAGLTSKMSGVLRSMSQVDMENNMHAQAHAGLEQAIELDSASNDLYGLAIDYWLMGYSLWLRYSQEERTDVSLLDSAKTFAKKAYKLAQDSEDPNAVASSSSMLIDVLLEDLKREKDSKARALLTDSCRSVGRKALSMCEECGLGNEGTSLKFNMAALYLETKQMRMAKTYLDTLSVEVMELEHSQADRESLYEFWAEYYETVGDYRKQAEYLKKYHETYTKNRQNDYVAQSAQNMAQANYNKQVKERDRLELQRKLTFEADMKRRNIVLMAACIVLLLVSALAVTAIRSSRRRHKMNLELDQKNIILEQQKEEMQTQNEDLERQRKAVATANTLITASINSAQMIQRAALPSEAYMRELWGEHFTILRPKDIVSGDFYWASTMGNRRLLVTADCTGHGVPGALVSMLGMSILSDIVARNGQENATAGQLLNEMRDTLKRALHQQGGDSEDSHGMDVALVIWEPDNRHIHFAGAFRPLLVFHNGEMTKIDGDRMPIGVHPLDGNEFTDHEIEVSEGDMIYIYSDGITDQFGHDAMRQKEVKFSQKRFSALLQEINGLPCEEQRKEIERTMDAWRGKGTDHETEQTDDNIIIGVRIG